MSFLSLQGLRLSRTHSQSVYGVLKRCLCHQQTVNTSMTLIPHQTGRSAQTVSTQVHPWLQTFGRRSFSHQIVEGSDATYRPTPFQRRILVWTKTYTSEKEIPEKIKRGQMKKAMDKFRVKVSIYMVAMTFLFAACMAMIGRKARQEGLNVSRMVLSRREREKNESD